MDFIDLPSIFQDKSVTSSIPDYFQNSEPPINCYKYNKPIRNMIFNLTPNLRDCKDSKFIYPSAGHVITGNLKISRFKNS